MNTISRLFFPFLIAGVSPLVQADTYLSPWLGYTFGGSVEDQNQNELDLKASESYALSLETDVDKGRMGLFYANQHSEVEDVNLNSSIHYLHIQSSIYYPVQDKWQSYLGVGLGASYVDADWVKDEWGFSASIFGGFEYQFSDSLALNTQLRWLGTVVDNETSGACNLPAGGDSSCVVKFKTDWMNQFSANLGLTWSF